MPIDRDATLKRAETLLRQGKLDLAIEEYVRLVEDQPRDWNSINALGDLYLRAGNVDRAVAQFTRIADYLLGEGFFPKASALYKKALKAKGDDEHTLRQLFEVAGRQGLLADAKTYAKQLSSVRSMRGDERGAAECLVLLGTLEDDDGDSKMVAARAAEGLGDGARAGEFFQHAATAFEKQERTADVLEALASAARLDSRNRELMSRLARECMRAGDRDRLRLVLTEENAGDDPELLLALATFQLADERNADARSVLTRLLTIAPERDADVMQAAAEVARRGDVDTAFSVVDLVTDAALLRGDVDRAVLALHTFVLDSRHIPALMRLVEVCVDNGLDAAMRDAQAELAEAYLDAGRAAEARVIAEDLVASDKGSDAHAARLRRALEMLGVADVESMVAAQRADNTGSLDIEDLLLDSELVGPADDPEPPAPSSLPVPDDPSDIPGVGGEDLRSTEPASPVEKPPTASSPVPVQKAFISEPWAVPAADDRVLEFDLSDVLWSLEGMQPVADASVPEASPDLETVFGEMRARVQTPNSADGAAQYERGLEALKAGRRDEALSALRAAAQEPLLRFKASAQMGRTHIEGGDLHEGVEWLERAAEAPAPTPHAGYEVLYDLAATLERMGETARALAVFMELEADAGPFRDIRERIERLVRVEQGSGAP